MNITLSVLHLLNTWHCWPSNKPAWFAEHLHLHGGDCRATMGWEPTLGPDSWAEILSARLTSCVSFSMLLNLWSMYEKHIARCQGRNRSSVTDTDFTLTESSPPFFGTKRKTTNKRLIGIFNSTFFFLKKIVANTWTEGMPCIYMLTGLANESIWLCTASTC